MDKLIIHITAETASVELPGYGFATCPLRKFEAMTVQGAWARIRDIHDGYAEDWKRFRKLIRSLPPGVQGIVIRIVAGDVS